MSYIAVEQAANKTQISETRRSERFLIDATRRRMGVLLLKFQTLGRNCHCNRMGDSNEAVWRQQLLGSSIRKVGVGRAPVASIWWAVGSGWAAMEIV